MLSLRANRKIAAKVAPLDNIDGVVYFGAEDPQLPAIEILVVGTTKLPTAPELREAYKWRKNNQARSVVVAFESNGRVHIYGPAEDRQPVVVETSTAARILQSALDENNPISARRHLIDFYDNLGNSEMSGIKNKGLFASHHLRENLPQRKDWNELKEKGLALAAKRHRSLIEALGFTVAGEERNTLILKAGGPENRVIAVLLEDAENFDSPSGRFPSSPVAWGLSVAADHNVPWLIVLKKDQIRLHPGRDGVGVGQKGQAETFLELNLAQIDDEHLALLPLIFSAHSLERDGDVQKILDESSKYAVILGARLRERVYESVVPSISIAVAKKLQSQGMLLDSEGLQKAYSITLRILFRLLFQAYAEDRGLLPAGRNEGYDANSLKAVAKRDMDANPEDFGNVVGIWHDLVQVWDAIDEGNPRWQVPAYNGGLFGRDPELHPEGALIKDLELTDSVLGPALQALLIDQTEDGVKGPVDFRSLVREFGTIYEGLLESSLSLAEVDLTVDSKDAWVPAQTGDTVMARAGEPYFHSASGERKATGSYFTPKFVVDHLVERAIDPTIDKHLEKIKGYLDAGDQATANREFFDFRVADLAMGSAHFLVAAVDRIEAKMRAFLSNPANTVPGVIDEIARLRKAATEALRGDEIAIAEIEDPSLLRRQIARRCIYGIDINPMAVELARLAIWIHTFVPGLPMSTLNHNLVCANSLTGIGSIDEALDALIPNRKNQPTFFDDAIMSGLEKAKDLLIDAANASEADKAEVAAGAKLAADAKNAAEITRIIFDAAVAVRLEVTSASSLFTEDEIVTVGESEVVKELIRNLSPAHMPYLFPEVFLRPRSGFDVLLGNPPWEKVQVEEHSWWGTRIPGLRGQEMAQRTATLAKFREARPELEEAYQDEIKAVDALRLALLKGPFPGLGKSNVDLYQAFAWRNWQLLRTGGQFGLVLPRGAMAGTALTEWREAVLAEGSFSDLTFANNAKHWIFEQVHASYAVVFAVCSKSDDHFVKFVGPVKNLAQLESSGTRMLRVDVGEFKSWTSNSSFPLIPTEEAFTIFRKLKDSPRLGEKTPTWEFGTVQGDFNGVTNKDLFVLGPPTAPSQTSVYAGATFNLWNPLAADPYGHAEPAGIRTFLTAKLQNSRRMSSSAYFNLDFGESSLPMDRPRIGFRDITNSTNTRTCIVSLLPAGIVGTHRVSFFVNRSGVRANEAFLLGVMSSIPFDWYMRRVVEMVMNFEIVKNSPVPHDKVESDLGRRVIEISALLCSEHPTLNTWIEELEIDLTGQESELVKERLLAELDAIVALLYGLERTELEHVFETFHAGWDFDTRLHQVLDHYDIWKDKA